MEALGLDLDDEHLRETPRRVAKMYARELLRADPYDFTTFEAVSQNLVVVRDIPFTSLCAHHFLPFSGVAHIGYIPGERMAGLSKLARLLDAKAAGPQVQERLTDVVADALMIRLDPLGVGVVIAAEHLCMSIRGAQKAGALTVTSSLRGALFEKAEARAEFLAMIQ